MKVRFFLALLFLASVANAAEIVVKYKPPYYLDDAIPFSIVVPPDATLRAAEPPLNLAIEERNAQPAGAMLQKWFVARPQGGGPARIPPYTITSSRGTETAPAVAFDVLPVRMSDNPDPAQVLARLRASGRPPVVGRVLVRPQPAYAGGLVQVVWAAAGDVLAHMTMHGTPPVEGAVELPPDPLPAIDLSGGMVAQRLDVRRIAFVPDQAGALNLPPLMLEGTVDSGGVTESITRMTPRQSIAILPVPGGLAPGKYTLHASAVQRGRLSIDIAGPGDAGIAHAPDLGDPGIPYLLQPRPLRIAYDRATRAPFAVRTWDIEFHPGDRSVTLPAIRYTSWDRDTQQNVTVEERLNATIAADAPVKKSEPIGRSAIVLIAMNVLLLAALVVTNALANV